MISALYKEMKETSTPMIKGEWFNIRICPDLYTQELINIGVGLVSQDGDVHAKLVDQPGRLECLYDKAGIENIMFLVEVIKDSIHEEGLTPPSPHIIYSEKKYTTGTSVDEILDYIFKQTVTVAAPGRELPNEENAYTDTDVRKSVIEYIKAHAGINAEKIIPTRPYIIIGEGNNKHRLDIPIQGNGLLGNILSANYSPNSLKMHLLEANMNLEVAAKEHKSDRLGVFIFHPKRVVNNKKILNNIDHVIEDTYWKWQRLNVHMDVEDSIEILGKRMMNWANIEAA